MNPNLEYYVNNIEWQKSDNEHLPAWASLCSFLFHRVHHVLRLRTRHFTLEMCKEISRDSLLLLRCMLQTVQSRLWKERHLRGHGRKMTTRSGYPILMVRYEMLVVLEEYVRMRRRRVGIATNSISDSSPMA